MVEFYLMLQLQMYIAEYLKQIEVFELLFVWNIGDLIIRVVQIWVEGLLQLEVCPPYKICWNPNP